MKNFFVIINYNDYKTTIKLIKNIMNYKSIHEIIVVDNNSNDESVKNLKKLDIKNLKIIESKQNGGYSYGLNLGCNYILKNYEDANIFISNSDIVIKDESDLLSLISYVSDKKVIVAPCINTYGTISRGWKIPSVYLESLCNIPGINNLLKRKNLYKDNHYLKKISEVDTVSGCFFLINSKHYKDINGFDENVFLYYEENIFGSKTKKLNKNIIVVNNVEVMHEHSITIDKNVNKINKVKMQKKSQYYFQKNYNNANVIALFLLKVTSLIGNIILRMKYFIER